MEFYRHFGDTASIAIVMLAWTCGFAADANPPDGPSITRLPSIFDLPQPPIQKEMLPGFTVEEHGSGFVPGDGTSLTSAFVQAHSFSPLGEPNPEHLRTALNSIFSKVQVATTIPQEPVPKNPLAETNWRLYLFWAPDLPLPPNIVDQIRQVRAEGFAFSQVAVISMRQWEQWAIAQNRKKDEILALINTRNREQASKASLIAEQWIKDLGPLKDFMDRVATAGVPIIPTVTPAIVLRVTNLPSWRLVSPNGRVHGINGIAETQPILAWCEHVKEWEISHEGGLHDLETRTKP